jgi:hypothetical protein
MNLSKLKTNLEHRSRNQSSAQKFFEVKTVQNKWSLCIADLLHGADDVYMFALNM